MVVMYVKRMVDIEEYSFSNFHKYVELCVFSVLSFCMSFFVGHPQILVGAIVNAFLISNSLKLDNYKLIPILIMPSVGVLLRGVVFGPFSVFLLYMIPFIWVGNFILVKAFRIFKLNKKMNYWLVLLIGAGCKALFLFVIAFALYSLGLIPVIFLTAMGILQFVTAILGGIIAFSYEKVLRAVKN